MIRTSFHPYHAAFTGLSLAHRMSDEGGPDDTGNDDDVDGEGGDDSEDDGEGTDD